jgi:hypothetical protein
MRAATKSPLPTHQATSSGLKIQNKAAPAMVTTPNSTTRNFSAALSGGPRRAFVPVSISDAEVIALLPH